MSNPLVSVIVPTYNSEAYLEQCLSSIKEQSYPTVELVVVDNNSTDKSKEIAGRFTKFVYNRGPERSAQRNYGVQQSKGEYVLIIDSDMVLSKDVVAECVAKIQSDDKIKGLVIPEESFGEGFWAQCKKLERSFYVGVDWMEAGRFFDKETYSKVDGYDENMVSGEDWDLSQRIEAEGKLDRIKSYIFHNEGKLSLLHTLRKKYYYASKIKQYTSKSQSNKTANQTSLIQRYKMFLSQPKKLFKNPLLGLGMLFMKTAEFGAVGLGMFLK